MKRRYRILVWIVLALALVLAAGIWLARDWPRLKIQSALAGALDAEVELGRLEIRDRRTFVLHHLRAQESRAWPWLAELSVERLTVTGSMSDILDNSYETIVVERAEAVVRNAEPAPQRENGGGFVVGRLSVTGGELVVRGGGGENRFRVEGELTGLGQGLGGEAKLRTDALQLLPLLSFLAGSDETADLVRDTPLDMHRPVEDLELDLGFDRGDTAAVLEVRAGGVIPFRRAGRDPLPFPEGILRLTEGSGEQWLFTAAARVPGLVSLDLGGRATADGGDFWIDRVFVESGDPVLLLHVLDLLPGEAAASGRAELTLERTANGGPLCRIDASADELTLPRAGGEVPDDPWRLDSLCPLDISYQGRVDRDGESGGWLTAGEARLVSATAGTLEADGSLHFGEGSESRLEASWDWAGPSITDLRRLAAGFGLQVSKRYHLDGSPRATGRVSGPLERPVVNGTLEVDGVAFCLEADDDPECDLVVSGGTLAADIRFTDQRDLHVPGLRFHGELQPVPLDPMILEVSGSGRIDPTTLQGRFRFESASFGDLARISGEGRWAPDGDPQLTAELQLEEAQLPSVRRALVPLTGEPLSGYELEAAVSGSGEANWSADAGWTAAGTLEMGEAWFASEDGARAVQGLASSWQVAAAAGPQGSLRAEASTTAGGFQLLWGAVFGDFQELQPLIRLAAGLEGGEGGSGRWWAEGGLQPVPGLLLQGSLSGDEGPDRRFTASLQVDDLAVAYDRCARCPLGDSIPLLTELDTAGSIQAFAEGHFREGLAVLNGGVQLDGLDLTGEEQTMTVRGLDLDLPLDLAWGATAGPDRHGRMGFEELRLDTLVFPRTDTALVVQGDTVSLEEPQSIPLLGGTVTFQQLTFADLLDEGHRRLVTELVLDGLQLADLSRAMDWPLFEGEIGGHLPRMELSPTRLRVDGGGVISLFGGTVSISDISGEEVLSRYPRISFSAEFSEIDLAQVTRTFDFGEVTGILEGRVDDCRLFAGTPVGFRAQLRTVPRKGVAQSINIKAINNIAIVGTGGRITVFDRGIHSMLDRYTYEQLGVKMRLEQDMFYLRGTEHRGDRELFLKGRLPFRIDVVNAEPGKTVSFSTMLSRLQALDFSQAVTDTGGGDGSDR